MIKILQNNFSFRYSITHLISVFSVLMIPSRFRIVFFVSFLYLKEKNNDLSHVLYKYINFYVPTLGSAL